MRGRSSAAAVRMPRALQIGVGAVQIGVGAVQIGADAELPWSVEVTVMPKTRGWVRGDRDGHALLSLLG
jgi:hypothetical protein